MKTTNENTIPRAALSADEAAEYLGVSLSTIHRLTRAGELAHVRVGRLIRFRREDLDSFLAERSTTKWEDFNPGRKRGRGEAPKSLGK